MNDDVGGSLSIEDHDLLVTSDRICRPAGNLVSPTLSVVTATD
jgi:hypothetical protein